MKHVQKAGGIVLNPTGDMVLIVTNKLGKVTLPKGSLQKGETHKIAARREILEEGGLKKVTLLKELGTIVRPGYTAENTTTPSVIKHIRIYLCTTEETDLSPSVKDIQNAKWVAFSDVAKILDWPEEAAFFEKHRSKLAV